MSVASKRGKDFEMRIARHMRQKGFLAAKDPRSGAGWFKGDIRIPGQNLHIEAKSQGTVKLGDWWTQTAGSAGYKTPILMVDLGGYEDLAVLRISDLLDMLKTIADDTATITNLRKEA